MSCFLTHSVVQVVSAAVYRLHAVQSTQRMNKCTKASWEPEN